MHHLPANRRPTRRGLLAGIAGLVVSSHALAQEANPIDAFQRGPGVREWQQKFDSGASTRVADMKADAPLLSPDTVAAIEQTLPRMQDLVARGGWPRVEAPTSLKVGSRSEVVRILRDRLAMAGDMPADAVRMGNSDTFDSYVDAAVRRFQIRHGLRADGVVDQTVMDVMNVPADVRLRQLETNLVRIRAMSGFLGDRYIFLNIPAAELEMVEGGRVVERHNAVVGKNDRQTPVLTSKVQEINFHPYWHVPVSIIRKDLIPKMQTEPDYLAKNHIRIFDGHNQEIPAESIDWNGAQAMQYQFRQDPGGDNAMSTVKVTFPNSYDVYMHDTPFKDLFGDSNRFYSSGCMRIQNIRGLVTWLLRDTPGWTPQAVDDALNNGARLDAKLKVTVPVYTNYMTAWVTREGIVNFRDDIYNRDGVGMLVAQD
ncbi:murein L,D-transpeptidase [Siculibacillus lacustris]|uniref:Murein L,D-transpeptidase n=1 Tax=Siculibacillus lacustris TaxID=1549641 RepID=A0A4Q9VU87_9HYPH|nr:L,D-transpeptidase family protein [Siculibacillus lacustris]TBW39728.1 murein L,D-transpeptidase [Siculibacillus lacustris]